jgi:hypothetical protein
MFVCATKYITNLTRSVVTLRNTDFLRSIYRGTDKSLARRGRKRLTGHLQPRRNWPTWASSVLITHPILRIWPRRTTTCSLDWKKSIEREVGQAKDL